MQNDLDQSPRFTTGIVANFLGIKPKTLINYENEDLVATKRSSTGRRLFSKKDVFDLLIIRHLLESEHMRYVSIRIVLDLLNQAEAQGVNLYNRIISADKVAEYLDQVRVKL
jgi:DNA-binding transcriptional MerR regulator